MAKTVLECPTWLYSAEAPTGRLFGEGDEHPGKVWQDNPEGLTTIERGQLVGRATSEIVELAGQVTKLQDDLQAAEQAMASQKTQFDAA